MKIYKDKFGHFYFAQYKEKGWFSLHCTIPHIDTLVLCPTSFGKEEDTAWDNAIEIPHDKYLLFNKIMQRVNNYNKICEFIMEFFDVSKEELDEKFDHYPDMIKLTREIIKESPYGTRSIEDYTFEKIYDSIKGLMNDWNNDIERVKKYVRVHRVIEGHLFPCFDMIDVWEENPMKRSLLYDFHNLWGNDNLDKYIDEAVELYPEKIDFDKRYYYVNDKLMNNRDGI